MNMRINVTIQGLDRLQKRYGRGPINRASHTGLQAALLQTESEAKRAATDIIYAKPDGGYRKMSANTFGAVKPDKATKKRVLGKYKRGSETRRRVSAILGSAGKRTGAYRASLGTGGSGNVRRLGSDTAAFGSRLNYAATIEKGSKPHVIRPKRGKALAFWGGSDVVVRKSVKHPGTKPRHVLKTAATQGRKRISDAYARAFWRELRAA